MRRFSCACADCLARGLQARLRLPYAEPVRAYLERDLRAPILEPTSLRAARNLQRIGTVRACPPSNRFQVKPMPTEETFWRSRI